MRAQCKRFEGASHTIPRASGNLIELAYTSSGESCEDGFGQHAVRSDRKMRIANNSLARGPLSMNVGSGSIDHTRYLREILVPMR